LNYLFSLELPSAAEAEAYLYSIKQAGFDGVEPTFLPEGFPSVSRYEEDAYKLREMADTIGLAIPSMRGGPLFWPRFSSPDARMQEEAQSLLDKAAHALTILGGDVLLVVPGMYEPGQRYDEVIARVSAMACRAADIALKHKITIGLENVQNQLLLRSEEWIRIMQDIGRPEIKCYYDIGNTCYCGIGDPALWIRELGREIICRVHVKDVTRDRAIVPLLQGDIQWQEVVQSLAHIGYNDWIGVELNAPKDDPLPFLLDSRKALQTIFQGLHSSQEGIR
jgi:sugar phosphate isomerase/epimerase